VATGESVPTPLLAGVPLSVFIAMNDQYGNLFVPRSWRTGASCTSECSLLPSLTSSSSLLVIEDEPVYVPNYGFKVVIKQPHAMALGGAMTLSASIPYDIDLSTGFNNYAPMPDVSLGVDAPLPMNIPVGGSSPGPLVGHSMAATKSNMYMIGGSDGNAYDVTLTRIPSAPASGNAKLERWTKRVRLQLGATAEETKVTSVTLDTRVYSEIAENCADIRFTSASGDDLPFWIDPQNACPGESTRVFIRNPTSIIYMFYGNPFASQLKNSGSSMDKVFDSVVNFDGNTTIPQLDGSNTTTTTLMSSETGPKMLFSNQSAVEAGLQKKMGKIPLPFNSTSGNWFMRTRFLDYGKKMPVVSSVAIVAENSTTGANSILGLDPKTEDNAPYSYVARAVDSPYYAFTAPRGAGFHTFELASGDSGRGVRGYVDGTTRELTQSSGAATKLTADSFYIEVGASNAQSFGFDTVLFVDGVVVDMVLDKFGVAAPEQVVWMDGSGFEDVKPSGNPPPPRVGAVLASDGDSSIYVYGGERSGIAYSDLFRYEETSNSWEYVDPLSLGVNDKRSPAPRSYAAGVSYNKQLFVFGGRSISKSGSQLGALSDVWRFDMDTHEWHGLDDMSTVVSSSLMEKFLSGVYGHSAVRVGTKMIIHGGYSAKLGRTMEETMIFDLETYDMFDMRDLVDPTAILARPQRRMHHTTVAHPTEPFVYLFGGYDEFSNEFVDLWQLDLTTYKWSQLTDERVSSMNTRGGLYQHASVSSDGFLMSYGGQGYGNLYGIFQGIPLYSAPPQVGA